MARDVQRGDLIGIDTPARQLLVDSMTAIDWNARARAVLRRVSGASLRCGALHSSVHG